MENISVIQSVSQSRPKYRSHQETNSMRRATTEAPSILGWYRILRVHYHWPLFQAIRYALWLAS